MKRSRERILTTHTGSLPRPDDLLALLRAREDGALADADGFAARVESAVAEVVRRQVAVGIDVVSGGEMGKPSFATYVAHPGAGFGGENPEPRRFAHWESLPQWAGPVPARPVRGRP